MKTRNAAKSLMVAVLAVIFLATALGFAKSQRAKVSFEPLDCYAREGRTVCFDGKPGLQMACEHLLDNTIICRSLEEGSRG